MSAKFTEGDMMRALRIADDSLGTAHLEAAAQLIADVRAEERARCVEIVRTTPYWADVLGKLRSGEP